MRYRVKAWAVALSVIFAIIIEWYLIVVESFENFQNAWGNFGGLSIYVFATLFSFLILKIAFMRIELKRFVTTFFYAMLVVIPIGIFWSYVVQGYISEYLLNPEWQFTHDFVYVAIITQFIVMSILLLGTIEDEGKKSKKDWNEYDDDW